MLDNGHFFFLKRKGLLSGGGNLMGPGEGREHACWKWVLLYVCQGAGKQEQRIPLGWGWSGHLWLGHGLRTKAYCARWPRGPEPQMAAHGHFK